MSIACFVGALLLSVFIVISIYCYQYLLLSVFIVISKRCSRFIGNKTLERGYSNMS